MARRPAAGWWSGVVGLGGLLLAPALAHAAVSGTVRSAGSGAPIAGAIVAVQASGKPVFTDAQGRYTLAAASAGARITAGAKGYYTAGQDAAGASLDFALEAVPHDPSAPVEFLDPEACNGCHATQVKEWKASRMAHAGRNTWVEDLYAGTATPGGMGGFVYRRDSVHATHSPSSECASCHQPEAWVAQPNVPLRSVTESHPTVEHGVSCLTCHLIAHVDESRPNDPGMLARTVTVNRGTVVRYGTLGDVDFQADGRMRGSYQPQLSSVVCGVCHQDANDPKETGAFDGPISEPTYLEWLGSPYGDPKSERYSSCMECHSRPSDAKSASSLQVTAERPAGQIRSHHFEGTTPEYLERAMQLALTTSVSGGVLEVKVALTNVGAGHHVPTGVTIRNMILLVEAVGPKGPLQHLGQETVSELGGVGKPEEGYYAGLPGKLYANVNEDASGNGPTLFTEAVRIRADNRIAALATDTTTYPFKLEGKGPVQVRARLLYRRAWRQLIDQKGWTKDGRGEKLADLEAPHYGHLMASAEATVTPPSPPSASAGGGGCASAGPSTAGAASGAVGLALALITLARSRRRRGR